MGEVDSSLDFGINHQISLDGIEKTFLSIVACLLSSTPPPSQLKQRVFVQVKYHFENKTFVKYFKTRVFFFKISSESEIFIENLNSAQKKFKMSKH